MLSAGELGAAALRSQGDAASRTASVRCDEASLREGGGWRSLCLCGVCSPMSAVSSWGVVRWCWRLRFLVVFEDEEEKKSKVGARKRLGAA